MSDESFFREVNEEIRHERTRALWTRFGRALIAVAVVAVLATAGYVAWRAYEERQANASGDRYLAALDLAAAGNFSEAVAHLEALTQDGYGAYPNLARMRIATVRVAEGDPAAAVAALDGIADDANTPPPLRDMAAIRAAYILVDTGTVDDVRARVGRLTGDAEPLRFPARETLGLSSWKAGDLDGAKAFFEQIRDGGGAPSGVSLRAGLMLEMIAAGSAPPSATAPAVETAPSQTPASADPAAPTAPAPEASSVPSATLPLPQAQPAPPTQPSGTPPSVPSAPAAEAPVQAPEAAPVAPASETDVPAPVISAPTDAPATAPAEPAQTPAATLPAPVETPSATATEPAPAAAPATPSAPPG